MVIVVEVIMVIMEITVVERSEIETFSLLQEFPCGPLTRSQIYRQLGKGIEERTRKTVSQRREADKT